MFWVRKIPQGLIRLYQWLISPIIHFLVGSEWGCRFSPSCSEYFRIAIQERGFFYGVWLGMGRVLRCHPFCSGGYDPVPLSKLECVTRNCQNKGS